MSLVMGEGNWGAARQSDTGVPLARVRAARSGDALLRSALILQS